MRIVTETTHGGLLAVGTLLWIGDRSADELHPAYRFCEQHAAQIAYRHQPREAIERPASEVRSIVLARSDRSTISSAHLDCLAKLYPAASYLVLCGRLANADRRQHAAADIVCVWHDWHRVLPAWLGTSSVSGVEHRPGVQSVAVIANSYEIADPLMNLITAAGRTAIWCRNAGSYSARNVDAYWWDESVASQADEHTWQQRIATCDPAATGSRHVWLAHAPTLQACQQAYHGGVEQIFSKPFAVDGLLEMLVDDDQHSSVTHRTPEPTARRRA